MNQPEILSGIEQWTSLRDEHRDAWLHYGSFYQNRWVSDGSLSPLDIYCYLRARFGRPNGPSMALRNPSTENIYQWHYVVAKGPRVIHFISRIDRMEIIPQCDRPPSVEDWAAFIARLKQGFGSCGKEMSAARRSLEQWQLWVNPTRRLSDSVLYFVSRVAGRELSAAPSLPEVADEKTGKEAFEAYRAFLADAAEIRANCLAIRMLVPVWGESFVNALLFLLRKKALRDNERLYQQALRQQIDMRILALPHNCDGFVRGIDNTAEQCAAFLTLMNARNQLLHGNLEPAALTFANVFFDTVVYDPKVGKYQIPMFRDDRNLAERLMEGCNMGLKVDGSLRDVKAVAEFREFVLGHLDHEVAMQVRLMLENPWPGWREETRRVGILFPQQIVVGIVGGKSRNETESGKAQAEQGAKEPPA